MEQRVLKLHWLLLGEFFGSFGNSFIWPLTTIYMHNQLHQSLTTSGIVLMIYSVANVLGSSLAGNLFDRRNPKRMMCFGLSGAIVIMLLLIRFNAWPAYPVLLTAFGFLNGWIITILNAFGTQITSINSRLVFNRLYFVNNLGVVFGTMVAGPLYQFAGNRVAPMFGITVVMYLAYIIVVQLHFVGTRTTTDNLSTPQAPKSILLPVVNRYAVWTLLIAIAVIWMAYAQWSSNLSVYMTGLEISMAHYSLLWTINGVLILVFQTIITWLTKRVRNDYWFIYFGVLACGGSFLILMVAQTYLGFVLGMVMLTLGEATAFPTIPAVVNTLVPARVKGKYQGFLNACVSSGKAIGPLLGGAVIEIVSYQGLFCLCTLIIGLVELVILTVSRLTHAQLKKY